MSEEVLITARDGAVATLTLNRPKARNALNSGLVEALVAGLRGVAEDPSVRAIVLTGAGGSFCAGADLRTAFAEDPDLLDHLDVKIDQYHAMIQAVVGAPKPVIAAVGGAAVGFGCDLALACDLRVGSEDAYFQEKFVHIGLIPDGGGTFWLPRLVGLGRALEMMMLGEVIPAGRALELGLLSRVVPAAELAGEAQGLAARLAKGAPLALAAVKKAARDALGGALDAALAAEKAAQIRLLRSSDCAEGIAAWMQKREPSFQGK